jgi:hypothetical protein
VSIDASVPARTRACRIRSADQNAGTTPTRKRAGGPNPRG